MPFSTTPPPALPPPVHHYCTACGGRVPPPETRCNCPGNGHLILDLADPAQRIAGRVIESMESLAPGAVLFNARNENLGRAEVVWVIEGKNAPGARDFQRRARIFAELHSPRAARVYDCLLPDDERADLVDAPMAFLEALDGVSLERRLGQQVFDLPDGVQIALDLCDPLAELHDKGLAHGRLDPRMVFLEGEGPMRARLASFGPSSATRAPYWPADGDGAAPTPADDVYALGMMLARMWVPRTRWTDHPSIAAAAPSARQRTLLKAMLAPRSDRLRDATAVLDALHPLRIDAEMHHARISLEMPLRTAVPEAPPTVEPAPAHRIWPLALGVLIAAGAAGYWALGGSAAESPVTEAAREITPRALGGAAHMPAPADRAAARPDADVEPAAVARPEVERVAPTPIARAPGAAARRIAPIVEPSDPAAPATTEAPPVDWPALPERIRPHLPLRRVLEPDAGAILYAVRHEITRGDWKQLAPRWPGLSSGPADAPMARITAGQAAWFCNALSKREGRAPCYAPCKDPARCTRFGRRERPCAGYRMPTRAEWEAIGVRAGHRIALKKARGQRLGKPVCLAVDGLDLCDFYGGVWEWTETAGGMRKPTAFRMGGSWDPGHRGEFLNAYEHEVDNPQPFVGLRPVLEVADPRISIGVWTYDPLAQQLERGEDRVTLEPSQALLFERLVRADGRLPAEAYSAEMRRGLGDVLTRLGGDVHERGDQLVVSPPSK